MKQPPRRRPCGAVHGMYPKVVMSEPLDYFNPLAPDRSEKPAGPGGQPGRRAIPVEFDTLLTQSQDHAAVRAVEVALGAVGITCFRSEGAGTTERPVELHVRGGDAVRASQIASELFARRRRVEQLLRHRRGPARHR